ncbi:hypothetical protein Y032_0522g2892 [Ancylostoma ceylanicum]|uniref:Uncharacterized protein n=1 Tax=Ancylostoma ceylanicum TaxID=53326 RepID=A0A016WTT8_9BILA|nr:hypothetical protein Y032_0522g2892 [Ancylostoma ceylanicum]
MFLVVLLLLITTPAHSITLQLTQQEQKCPKEHQKKCGTRIAEIPRLQSVKEDITVRLGRRRAKRMGHHLYPQKGSFSRGRG